MPLLLPTTSLPRDLLPTLFQTNDVPLSALQADARFSYAAFIPDQHYNASSPLPLLVAIHGTRRRISSIIDAWRAFAIEYRCAILVPLFPALVSGATDVDGYHFLGNPPSDGREKLVKGAVEVPGLLLAGDVNGQGKVRHDLILLQMLEEVKIRWPGIETEKIFLAGFSGGGQFANRFMYLHPERLHAVSVGAPGNVTSLDFEQDWPQGLKDVEEIFGTGVDGVRLKRVPILASVGEEDHGVAVAKAKNALHEKWRGGEDVGKTRVQRLEGMVEEWQRMGMDVEFRIVPGVGHEMEKVIVVVLPFMARQLDKYRETQEGFSDRKEGA